MENKRNRNFYTIIIVGIALVGLYILSFYNYLLFHAMAEFFSIAIAMTIFILIYNSRKYLDRSYLIIIGYAYLFVGILDFLHVLGFKGMDVFPDYDYYANQLWIAARFYESIALLVSMILLKKNIHMHRRVLFSILLGIFGFIIISIFQTDIFPACYVEGIGQTLFKIISEYVIILILVISMLIVYVNRSYFGKEIFMYFELSIILTIFSEFAFTLYVDNYGLFNMIGHYLKIASFYFIYKAVIQKCIEEPYDTIFKELNELKDMLGLENKQLLRKINFDGLTGVYNHRYMIEAIHGEIERYERFETPFTLMFIDLDDFKKINDTYSHLTGDKVLMDFANILRSHCRQVDIVGRFGGDEFIIVLVGTDKEHSVDYSKRLLQVIRENQFGDDIKVTISVGLKSYEGQGYDQFMKAVDQHLYDAKAKGKDQIIY